MTLRMIKYISYLVITSGYINYTQATQHSQQTSHINKRLLMRCNSSPNLTALYNMTNHMVSNDNQITPYNKYKSIVFNRYKRNVYLRSKEKYTFAEK